jgi:threonine dehydratase
VTAALDPAARPVVPHPDLTAAAVRAGLSSIAREFLGSRQLVHEGLSALAGDPVVVKVETENPVGSFKGRGTWLAVRRLEAAGLVGPRRPVVVASSGNFGQGVAYAARAAGVGAVVFCDAAANPRKADRIRSFGADLRLVGRDFDEARAASEAFAGERGLPLLVDGDDVAVAAGAATIALEVTDAVDRGELPPIANAYVPVGNGALIIGVGAWLRERGGEGVRIVGVQSDGAPSMTRSWREGRIVETPDAATYAEGIATRVPVPSALTLMDGRVDEMLLVGEGDLHVAQAVLTTQLGLTAEGSAAASWAGLLADPDRRPGASLVIVTGGNVAGPPG